MATCKLCNKAALAKGLCNTHYQKEWYQQNKKAAQKRIREQRARKKASDPVWHEHWKQQNKKWKRAPNSRYLSSLRAARNKNLPFTLTKERYLSIIANPCHYCNGFFPKVECNLGLDRIDNDRGYELDNVVSCCATCNHTRNSHFTVEETKAIIQLIITLRGNNATSN